MDDFELPLNFAKDIKEKLFDDIEECLHDDTIMIEDQEICKECGMTVETNFDKNKYENDNRQTKDSVRCHKRKSEQRTIYKDVEGMDFPDTIVQFSNDKYQTIIKDNIYRGAKRKAIIVACIFHAYKFHGEPRDIEDISLIFKIKKKNVKEGMTKYGECFRDSLVDYIEARDLIRKIMIRTKVDFSHLKYINRLYDFLEGKSEMMNRSTPQSVASTIVYLYLCLEPEYKQQLEITKVKFASIIHLSDITITKLGKEFLRILQNDDIKI